MQAVSGFLRDGSWVPKPCSSADVASFPCRAPVPAPKGSGFKLTSVVGLYPVLVSGLSFVPQPVC